MMRRHWIALAILFVLLIISSGYMAYIFGGESL